MPVILDLMEYVNDAAAQAAYVTNGAGTQEITTNPSFEDWTGGDNVAPDGWTFGEWPPDGSAVAKESTIIKVGTFSAKPTRVTEDCGLYQDIAPTRGIEYWKGKTVTLGCWVYATVANRACININDGVTESTRIYHPGDSTWRWLTVTHVVSATATGLRPFLYVINGDTSAYFDGAILIEGNATGKDGELHHLQSYFEDTIKEQGSYSLKGMAAITDGLNKTLTRTVDPTIDLSGIDKIYLIIRASRTGSNIKIGIHDSGGTTTEITPNIASADAWQAVEWDISGVADGNKDAIDSIIITIVNADAYNMFYLDDIREGWPVLTLTENLALLESLPLIHRKPPPFEEALALKDVSNIPACPDIILGEALALKESLTEISRALLLTEAIALKESLPTIERQLTLEEVIALKESLPLIRRQLPPLEEAIALKEEVHAEALLFKVDKSGNITYMGTLDEGAF